MKKALLITLLAVAVVFIVGLTVFSTGSKKIQTATVMKAELSNHNSMDDCWIAYQNKAYDLTSWLPNHPGSAEVIIPFCGTSSEFEEAFTEQHENSQVDRLLKEGIFKGNLI